MRPSSDYCTVIGRNAEGPFRSILVNTFNDSVGRVTVVWLKHRKNRTITETTHSIITPKSRRNHTSIQTENLRKFAALKSHERLQLEAAAGERNYQNILIHAIDIMAVEDKCGKGEGF